MLCLCKTYATEPMNPPGEYHVPTLMYARLVCQTGIADAGWYPCAAERGAPASKRRAASVADDIHASRKGG